MQYASALALASLSGKAPSKALFTQPRTPLPQSLKPPGKTAMPLKSMLSLSHSTIEKSMKYHSLHLGH